MEERWEDEEWTDELKVPDRCSGVNFWGKLIEEVFLCPRLTAAKLKFCIWIVGFKEMFQHLGMLTFLLFCLELHAKVNTTLCDSPLNVKF